MITMVTQVSSVWFDDKFLRKSLHNEANFNKCEFREKFCEFINSFNNSVEDSWLESTKLGWIWFSGIFPGLNTLDNARENEIRFHSYQSYKQDRIYRCGEFDHTFPHTCNVLWNIGQIGCRENKIFQKRTKT